MIKVLTVVGTGNLNGGEDTGDMVAIAMANMFIMVLGDIQVIPTVMAGNRNQGAPRLFHGVQDAYKRAKFNFLLSTKTKT